MATSAPARSTPCGVVSPAQRACAPTHENVLGVLSLIFWALALIVSVKYIAFVLRADNRGEGGILALMALAFPERDRASATRAVWLFTMLGIFGAALLYGDGLITPAITVLGAVEGLEVATPVVQALHRAADGAGSGGAVQRATRRHGRGGTRVWLGDAGVVCHASPRSG